MLCRWVVNGTGLAVAAVAGEWLCMQKEMQDIPLATLRQRPERQRNNERPRSNGVPVVTELTAINTRK